MSVGMPVLNLRDVPLPMRALLTLTAWFTLVLPLWYYTLKLYRAPLEYEQLSFYETQIGSVVNARVPVYLETSTELADIVDAANYVANQKFEKWGINNWTIGFKDATEAKRQKGDLMVKFEQANESSYHLDSTGKMLTLNYDLELLTNGHVADMVVDVLANEVFKDELYFWSGSQPLSEVAASYSPQLHIALSVLSGAGNQIEWDAAKFEARFSSLASYIQANVCNITFDSQVDQYARLGCQPKQQDGQFVLNKDALSTFVNFAEWNLASTMPYPTLNFILYVADPGYSPLVIENSASNSFLIPQWGGVAIQPEVDIDAYFPIFQAHLLSLLGTPTNPQSLQLRLDSLSRIYSARGILATAKALGSLDRLAKNMENIPIPNQVQTNSETAIDYLKRSLASVSAGDYAAATKLAGLAYVKAQAAFFDKRMVSQAFFPDEHKMAVYLPLLAPIALLLVQRWRGLKLFKDVEFRRQLAECDKTAAQAKIEASKQNLI